MMGPAFYIRRCEKPIPSLPPNPISRRTFSFVELFVQIYFFSIVFNFLPRNNPVGAGTSIFSRSLGIEWELLSRFSWLWILLERKNLIKVMNGINARSQTLVEQIFQIGKLFSVNNLINIFEESWRWWRSHISFFCHRLFLVLAPQWCPNRHHPTCVRQKINCAQLLSPIGEVRYVKSV